MSLNIKGDIGKVWLGGVQMGKVYQGEKLIYTAQTQIYPGTQPVKHYTKNKITVEDFTITRAANTESYGICYIPVELTECDILDVKGELCGYVAVGLTDILPTASVDGASDMVFSRHYCVWTQVMKSTNKDVMEVDAQIDVKDLTGTYYLVAAIYGSNVTLPTSFVEISSVIGR